MFGWFKQRTRMKKIQEAQAKAAQAAQQQAIFDHQRVRHHVGLYGVSSRDRRAEDLRNTDNSMMDFAAGYLTGIPLALTTASFAGALLHDSGSSHHHDTSSSSSSDSGSSSFDSGSSSFDSGSSDSSF